jgi:hypothetical protein
MDRRKRKIAGTSLVEVLLALGISCLAASGALAMLAAADYQFAKSRTQSLLGGQVRYFLEMLAGMPYPALTAKLPPGESAGNFYFEGFFVEETPPKFPWKLDVRLERTGRNTAAEFTTVKMTFTWQEPAPGFPRAKNLTKTLSCPSFQRSRF